MTPMFDPAVATNGPPAGLAIIAIAVAGLIVGFAWMRRITRNPEDDDKSWRYRKHD